VTAVTGYSKANCSEFSQFLWQLKCAQERSST